MSKYDFGYVLEKGSTNEWAFHKISEGSKVLEVGSATGNLTYHLKEIKGCVIDIVEIDEDAGLKAGKYARNALLGMTEGNLNFDFWYKKLNTEKYDYIVILDVLEHLQDPENTLNLLKDLLHEDGEIILSIPNIGHNAVILGLLNNQFNYTELGLLDNTHIHFFSYFSIMKMLEHVGLNKIEMDAIKKSVSDTEIPCDISKFPVEIQYYLRTREYADVYQFLFVLGRKKDKCVDMLKTGNLQTSLYTSRVLINGLSENMVSICGKLGHIRISIDLSKYNDATSIRFIPSEYCCLVMNLKAYAIDLNGNSNKLIPNWITGIKIDDTSYVMAKEAQEINYQLEEKMTIFVVQCDCRILSDDLEEAMQIFEQRRTEISKYFQKELNDREGMIAEKNAEIEQQNEVIRERNEKLIKIKQELDVMQFNLKRSEEELSVLKNSRWYKVATKINSVLKR